MSERCEFFICPFSLTGLLVSTLSLEGGGESTFQTVDVVVSPLQAPGALPCAVSGALPSVPVVPSAPSELTARGRSRGHSRDTPGLLWDTAPLTLRSDATPPSFPLERRRSSGPLCFVDPRFPQTRRHHRREDNRREDNRREDIRREDNPPWCVREPCNDLDDETSSVKPLRSSERHVDKTQPNSKSPPSRPRPLLLPLHQLARCRAGALLHPHLARRQRPLELRACQKPLLHLQERSRPSAGARLHLDPRWVPSIVACPKPPSHQPLCPQTRPPRSLGNLIWKLTAATLPWTMRP